MKRSWDVDEVGQKNVLMESIRTKRVDPGGMEGTRPTNFWIGMGRISNYPPPPIFPMFNQILLYHNVKT